MEITFGDRYRLDRLDDMNLQMHEYRDVRKMDKPASKGGKPTGETEKRWMPMHVYFADVPSAVAWLYRKLQRDDPMKGELADALLRMEAIKDELIAEVTR